MNRTKFKMRKLLTKGIAQALLSNAKFKAQLNNKIQKKFRKKTSAWRIKIL